MRIRGDVRPKEKDPPPIVADDERVFEMLGEVRYGLEWIALMHRVGSILTVLLDRCT